MTSPGDPHGVIDWMWISASLWALVALVVGLLVFRRGEKEYGRG
jgi:ABC-type polysaccharide/polyol phosphate export permease